MNENKINKPMSLLKEDFVNNLINLCNSSELPLCVIEYVLRDAYLEVKDVAQQQLERDRIEYNNELKNIQEEV